MLRCNIRTPDSAEASPVMLWQAGHPTTVDPNKMLSAAYESRFMCADSGRLLTPTHLCGKNSGRHLYSCYRPSRWHAPCLTPEQAPPPNGDIMFAKGCFTRGSVQFSSVQFSSARFCNVTFNFCSVALVFVTSRSFL